MSGSTSIETKLYRDTLQDSSAETWEEVANLNSVGFPDKTREVVDLTHLNSTNQYRAFKGGFRDAGRVAFQCNYTKGGYEKLNADFNRNNSVYYKIVLGDSAGSYWIFEGLITRLGGNVPEGSSKIITNCEIKLSGQPEAEPS